MRRIALFCLTVASIVAVVIPSGGVAANLVFHSHNNFSNTFADNACGIPGTGTAEGVENFQAFADGTFRGEFHLNLTFTSTATGQSIQLLAADQSTGNFHAIVHEDGTFTFTTTYKGLTVLLKIPNGPTLSRDAGVITFADTFAATPPYDLISETVSGEKGPHPELGGSLSADFCDVIVPALT